MRQGRARRWITLLSLFGAGLILLWRTWPREPLLLSRSLRVEGCCSYNWLSPHSLLLFQKTDAPSYRWSVEQITLPDLHHMSCLSLARRLPSNAENFDTSPDGRWLLWIETKNTSYNGVSHGKPEARGSLLNLQTQQVSRFPLGQMCLIDTCMPDPLVWMADSRHWVEMSFEPCLVRSVNTPQQATPIRMKSNQGLESYSSLRILSTQRVLAATPGSFNKLEDHAGRTLPQLVQTDLIGPQRHTHQTPLPLPYETLLLKDVVFSPQGDRYALSALVDPHPGWYDFLHRYWPALRLDSRPRVGLWVYSIDGKRSQELGYIVPEAYPSENPIYPYFMPSDLRWSPDGKKLGYTYKGALYTVPVD